MVPVNSINSKRFWHQLKDATHMNVKPIKQHLITFFLPKVDGKT
jgi:hypothetical protein